MKKYWRRIFGTETKKFINIFGTFLIYDPCPFIRRRISIIRFFQQRGILHQNRNCEKCGREMRGNQWEATINGTTTINNGQQGSKLPFLSILKFLYW